MKICDESYHGEIVHEGKHCLACETIEEFKDQVKSLKAEIDGLKVGIEEVKRAPSIGLTYDQTGGEG